MTGRGLLPSGKLLCWLPYDTRGSLMFWQPKPGMAMPRALASRFSDQLKSGCSFVKQTPFRRMTSGLFRILHLWRSWMNSLLLSARQWSRPRSLIWRVYMKCCVGLGRKGSYRPYLLSPLLDDPRTLSLGGPFVRMTGFLIFRRKG